MALRLRSQASPRAWARACSGMPATMLEQDQRDTGARRIPPNSQPDVPPPRDERPGRRGHQGEDAVRGGSRRRRAGSGRHRSSRRSSRGKARRSHRRGAPGASAGPRHNEPPERGRVLPEERPRSPPLRRRRGSPAPTCSPPPSRPAAPRRAGPNSRWPARGRPRTPPLPRRCGRGSRGSGGFPTVRRRSWNSWAHP